MLFSAAGYELNDSVTELPKTLIRDIDYNFLAVFESSTDADYSNVTVNDSSEEEFLGLSALRTKGTISLSDGTKLNYIAHYSYLDFWESGDTYTPSFWMAFTESDSKDALDLMEQAAELPLTKSKLYES